MGNPPYSPDLLPNDFFLFLHIKIAWSKFPTFEEAVDAFKMHVLEVSQLE